MRRRTLSKLGFHTGSPFSGTTARRSEQPPGLTRPASHTGATTGNESPAAASDAVRRAASETRGPTRTASAAPTAPRRQNTPITAVVGRSGSLDPGRLAAARSHYEERRAAAAAARPALERPQSAGEATPPASTTAAATSSSASAPVSRQTSLQTHSAPTQKRQRDDDRATQELDEEDDLEALPTKRPRLVGSDSSDMPPPLETATGSLASASSYGVAAVVPAAAAAAAAAPSFLSNVESLATPLSAMDQVPVAAPVDVRQRTRDMIEQALREASAMQEPDPDPESQPPSEAISVKTDAPSLPDAAVAVDIASLSRAIEAALMYACSCQDGPVYRQRVRSLLFNLRRNASLARRLLRGELTPYGLSQLTDAELASAETQAEREEIRAANLAASIAKTAARIPTRDFRCDVCGSDDCSTRVLREERDISKADTWGSKQGAGSATEIQCSACKHSWVKEE